MNALKTINKQLGGKRSVRIGKFQVASDEYPFNEVTKTKVNQESARKFRESAYDIDDGKWNKFTSTEGAMFGFWF